MEVVRPSSSSEEDVIVVWKFVGMKMWCVFYELRKGWVWPWLLNDYIYTKSQFKEPFSSVQ